VVAETQNLLLLIGETAKLDDASRAVSKPVIFKCPSCLAGLDIDGARRIVSCRYCDSDIYLPDDLWMHLNPTVKRARWWMLLRPSCPRSQRFSSEVLNTRTRSRR
jgi:hypothetical protein